MEFRNVTYFFLESLIWEVKKNQRQKGKKKVKWEVNRAKSEKPNIAWKWQVWG